MNIAVFGAGGVGGYFGGRLAQGGANVTLIARGAHLAALRKHGMRLESPLGDAVVAVRAGEPAGLPHTDLVLVAVKMWQLPRAMDAMAPLIGPQTTILPLLNGITAPEQLADRFGPEKVLNGFCRVSAYRAGPGRVVHAGIEPAIVFGERNDARTARVTAIRDLLDGAPGMAAEIAADSAAALWRKFLIISPWSCLGSLTRQPVGGWRAVPQTRDLWHRALEELLAVGRAAGVHLNDEDVRRAMDFVDRVPPETLASMQRDVLDGRPSEFEGQCGDVVRLGRRHDVATPLYDLFYAALLPGEMAARGETA